MKQALRLCYVVSSQMTVSAFLKDHIAAASDAGYEVSVVANTHDEEFLTRLGLSASFHSVAIVRHISPLRDLLALLSLCRLFFTRRFDIVHSISPKAGLLSMIAASLTRVPHRIHTFTGQVWVTQSGVKRWLLKQVDRLLAALTTRALVDSASQREFLLAESVLDAGNSEVVGSGSICGVDSLRFRPDREVRRAARDELGIPENTPLLLFLGRLTRDKGVLDLALAFARLAERFADVRLLLVGPDEAGLSRDILRVCGSVKSRVHFVGFTAYPERYMASADIFCLASYREGFGAVVIEAAATGIPCVASRIYGITDAVIDGCTGLLHAPGDVEAIESLVSALILDLDRRLDMGVKARRRALTKFSRLESSKGLLAFYGKMIDGKTRA